MGKDKRVTADLSAHDHDLAAIARGEEELIPAEYAKQLNLWLGRFEPPSDYRASVRRGR